MSRSPSHRTTLCMHLILIGLTGLLSTAALAQRQDGYIGPESNTELRLGGIGQGSKSGGYRGDEYRGDDFRGEWEFCARERERCNVRGWGLVRYGADGRYVYREVRNATLACDNTMFGDPAPRRGKSCDVLYTQSGGGDGGWGNGSPGGSDWVNCAREGGVCRLPGPATVRYGAEGNYAYERFNGGTVRCDNGIFGDPAPRRGKGCDFQLLRGGHGGGGYGGPNDGGWGGGWSECAREGGYCEFRGRRAVRYGTDDRYVVRDFRSGTECSNAAFGEDPAPRKRKQCWVEVR